MKEKEVSKFSLKFTLDAVNKSKKKKDRNQPGKLNFGGHYINFWWFQDLENLTTEIHAMN